MSAVSLASSGALILGFYVMLRDRRRHESDQARKIAVWDFPMPHHEYGNARKYDYEINIKNNSDNDIYRIRVKAVPIKWSKYKHTDDPHKPVYTKKDWKALDLPCGTQRMLDDGNPMKDIRLEPGMSVTFDHEPLIPTRYYETHVLFVDVMGNHWVRTIKKMELKKIKTQDLHLQLLEDYEPG